MGQGRSLWHFAWQAVYFVLHIPPWVKSGFGTEMAWIFDIEIPK